MFFGARITYERNDTFPPGLFTLRVWQGTKPLFMVWAEVPNAILDEIHKLGALFNRQSATLSVNEAFVSALLRWCIRETERRLRDGQFHENLRGIMPIVVTASDVPTIMFFYREKTCRYQRVAGGELFCSIPAQKDLSARPSDGPALLEATTKQLCRNCDLPDTDLICSHLTHPTIYAELSYPAGPVIRRAIAATYCELGKDQHGSGFKCRGGGNDCWEREVEVAVDAPAAPYSPRELPTALDFLNVIWQQAFKRPLFTKATFQKPASLSLPCGNQDEFIARVADLNELLRKMDIPDDSLPEENQSSGTHPIPEVEKLNRLSACLHKKLVSDEHAQTDDAIDILKAINVVRNKITHGGAELIGALKRLGINYPIIDHQESWDRIRSKAAEALTMLRSALETVM